MEPEDAPVHGPHRDQLGYAGRPRKGRGGVLWATPRWHEVPPVYPQLPSPVPGVQTPSDALGWEGTESPV